ncbi:O-antigen translocase [Flavobacterium chuncheonense]|uniref:O-antigen translocase n=1 Tax=Flavobacterium chuncheonense TaxID=2026653 RepID=A0ABW5YPE0_9FLAO
MSKIRNFFYSNLFRVSSLNSLSLLIRIFTGLVSSWAISRLVGPSGMALMGNFRSFTSSLEAVGTLGLQNGIVKTIAEKQKDKKEVYTLLSTVFYVLLGFSALLSSCVFFNSDYFTITLLNGNMQYELAFKIVALTVPFGILHLFFTAVINGFSAYKKVISTTIFSHVFGLFLTVFLMWKWGVLGALLAVSLLSIFLFCFSGFYFTKLVSVSTLLDFQNFDFNQIKKIWVYASMALFSAIVSPLIYIYIRKLIMQFQSLEASGFYEAMNRISSFYMMFITSLVSLYFLPEMSKTIRIVDNKPIIYQYYKTIFPVFALGLVLLYFMRDTVVEILYTDEFSSVSNLFIWQLVGDFFRAATLILAIQFFAKRIVKTYFITEVLSFSILCISSYYCIQNFGLEGAVMAYAITYVLYFLAIVFYFRKML